MSYKRVRTLGDCQRFQLSVEVICANGACGRRRVVDPFDLIRIFGSAAQLDAIGSRMRCRGKDLQGGGCGHRGALIRFSHPDEDPPPDDTPGGQRGGNVVPLPVFKPQPQTFIRRARSGW